MKKVCLRFFSRTPGTIYEAWISKNSGDKKLSFINNWMSGQKVKKGWQQKDDEVSDIWVQLKKKAKLWDERVDNKVDTGLHVFTEADFITFEKERKKN